MKNTITEKETKEKMNNLIGKKEACKILGIRPSTIDVLLAKKQLPVVRFNRRVLFDVNDLQSFIERNKQKPEDWQ